MKWYQYVNKKKNRRDAASKNEAKHLKWESNKNKNYIKKLI